MQTTWRIERGVFPATAPAVIALLDALGIPWSDHRPHDPPAADDRCVLFWGALQTAYGAHDGARRHPGAVGDPRTFRCSSYHPRLRPLLANADAVFTTAAQLVADPRRVARALGCDAQLFVRPDSPLKPFAGRLVPIADLSLDHLDHGFYYDDEQLPIVASSPKAIGAEHRFVIADGRVVGACGYAASRDAVPGEVPADAAALADAVARDRWQPAPLYVADVGQVGGRPRLLEINLFSGADLYGCACPELIRAACGVAARLHGDPQRADPRTTTSDVSQVGWRSPKPP